MKRIIIMIVLIAQATFANGVLVNEISEKSIFKIINISANSMGTGFIINKEGYLVTNHHVIKGYQAGKLIAVNIFNKHVNIEVIKTYPKKDIALLKINGYIGSEYLKLTKPELIKKGIASFSLGYPGGSDTFGNSEAQLTTTLKPCVVSKITLTSNDDEKFEPNYKLIETCTTINSGDSGGPLLSSLGTVMGINIAKNSDIATLKKSGEVTQGIFWAIHVEELIKVLKENSINYTVSNDLLENESSNKLLYFISFLMILSVIFFIVYIVKFKQSHSDINKKELSVFFKEKLKKHLNDNNHDTRVVKPKDLKVRQIIKLIPKDKSLPQIVSNNKSVIVLGRSQESDIVIINKYISRQHLKIYFEDISIMVEDMDSSNGSYIDGKKLIPYQKTELNRDEKLILGSEDIIYTIR